MKKTKILSLLLSLSLFCTLIAPGTTAYAEGETKSGSGDNGMKISKTATANPDGSSYTITLEAFATGEKTTQTTDVPTDIVLVLDQSGSMEKPIGGYTYTAYRQREWGSNRNYHNDEYYPLRHNGGSGNLWYKLNDNEYVAVSVEQQMEYDDISDWNNRQYYDNQNNLYCRLDSGEYKSVAVKREGHLFSADEYWYTVDGRQILYTTGDSSIPDFEGYAPLYQSVKKYTYSYTLNGTKTVIDESIGDGSSPNTQFYRRDYSSSAGGTRLNALKNAATTFVNAVAAKAAGKDGNINTTKDNIDHRIAVVGFASEDYNTGVFIGSELKRYETAAAGVYGTALQDMSKPDGKNNVTASINELTANGATRTDLGLKMAKGILYANPVPQGKTRNRVVIVFTDGSPTSGDGFEKKVAQSAIDTAKTIKDGKTTVYSIGVFPSADANSAGTEPSGNLSKYDDLTAASNWFMQKLSSNNGTPQQPSYYLSAGDAASLNSIFQQISNNIGGSSTTLDSKTVVKDVISPYFTLPAGASAKDIQINTYDCTGKNGNTYTWSDTTSGNGGATATVEGDKVSVTGFNFSENWCGTETNAQGTSTVRGKKLVISFKVKPKEDFLGGNGVPTNTSAGIYENANAQEPVMTFPVPTVNVPIKDVIVNAQDKNVYLLGNVTENDCKTGATAMCNGVDLLNESEYTGDNAWKAAYVNITTAVITPDAALTADGEYTISVKVEPKPLESGIVPPTGAKAVARTGTATQNINVFKPELTFKDSEVYYGDTAPDYTGNLTDTKWKHGEILSDAEGVTMIDTAPTPALTYTPEEGKIAGEKINTKQDIAVDVAVKIDGADVTTHTTFQHTDCKDRTCTVPTGKEFLLHVKTCTLNITKQDGADDESYVFNVYKDDKKYSEVTIEGNTSQTLVELPVGTYTIKENEGWSWRYTPSYSSSNAVLNADKPTGSIICTNTKTKDQWLNGFSKVVRNIYGEKH